MECSKNKIFKTKYFYVLQKTKETKKKKRKILKLISVECGLI